MKRRSDDGIAKSVKEILARNVPSICVGAVGSGYEVAARQILGIYGMNYDDIDERFLARQCLHQHARPAGTTIGSRRTGSDKMDTGHHHECRIIKKKHVE
jgi:hypothetical protein